MVRGGEWAPERVTARELMRAPIVTIAADARLQEARRLMETNGFHHLVVTDRGRAVGMLSDRDILRHLSPFLGTNAEQGRDLETLQRPVYHAATYGLITIRSDATILEAAAMMLDRGVSALPVVDGALVEGRGKIVGMLTARDLLHGTLSCLVPTRWRSVEEERRAS